MFKKSVLEFLVSHVTLAGTRRDVDSWLDTQMPGTAV